MTRLMFVATYNKFAWGVNPTRLQDAALSLMFDDFLHPRFTETIIYYGPGKFDVDVCQYLQDLGINTNTISLRSDADLLDQAGISSNTLNFRPAIKQQLIKLIALDQSQSSVTMIQDCDIFAIKPYHWYQNHQVNLYYIANTTNLPQWYEYVEKFTGQPRVDNNCYMSEFLPISQQDWYSLRHFIECKYQQHWLQAIAGQFEQDLNRHKELEFSEFELLANWILQQNHATNQPQVRMSVPAPLIGRQEHAASWYARNFVKHQPNCLTSCNFAAAKDLKAVSAIIRSHCD